VEASFVFFSILQPYSAAQTDQKRLTKLLMLVLVLILVLLLLKHLL